MHENATSPQADAKGHEDIKEMLANASPESILALASEAQAMLRKQEILKQHRSKISRLRGTGPWFTRVNGKKIQRKKKEYLIDTLVQIYDKKQITRTISSVFQEYISERKTEVNPGTWAKETSYYDQFIQTSSIADIPLDKLRVKHANTFLHECLEKKPNMTRKYWTNLWSTVNKLLRYAVENEYMPANPFRDFKPKRNTFQKTCKPETDTVFGRNEVSEVIKYASTDAEKTHSSIPLGIILFFQTGLRMGELCALKWCDLYTDDRGITKLYINRQLVTDYHEDGKIHGVKVVPRPKTENGYRSIVLNKTALYALNMIRQYNAANDLPVGSDDYVFLRTYNGQVTNCTSRCFDARLRRYCRAAGMAVIKSSHDIRRTVLTNLSAEGMDIKDIQQFAGHGTVAQTMDYLRFVNDRVRDERMASALDELYQN